MQMTMGQAHSHESDPQQPDLVLVQKAGENMRQPASTAELEKRRPDMTAVDDETKMANKCPSKFAADLSSYFKVATTTIHFFSRVSSIHNGISRRERHRALRLRFHPLPDVLLASEATRPLGHTATPTRYSATPLLRYSATRLGHGSLPR